MKILFCLLFLVILCDWEKEFYGYTDFTWEEIDERYIE